MTEIQIKFSLLGSHQVSLPNYYPIVFLFFFERTAIHRSIESKTEDVFSVLLADKR